MHQAALPEPFRALLYAPFYLARAIGAFARERIDLRLVTAGSPDEACAALLAGRTDLAWSGPRRPLLLRGTDPGCPLHSFWALVMRDPFLLMGGAPRPGFWLEELFDLRLGLVPEVPTPVWCLRAEVATRDRNWTSLPTVTGRNMAENAEAVERGGLDLAQFFEPFACRVENAGGAPGHAQARNGLTAYTALYATEARHAGKRGPLMAMVRVVAKALAFTRGAPPGEAAERIPPPFPDVPSSPRVRAIARHQALGLRKAGPRFPREAFDRLGAAMRASGVVPHVSPFEACVDEAIVTEALV